MEPGPCPTADDASENVRSMSYENSVKGAIQPSHTTTAFLPLKARIKMRTPKTLLLLYRFFRTGEFLHVISFLHTNIRQATFSQRCALIRQIYRITYHVECGHAQAEILGPITRVLAMTTELRGAIVEAGCFKGGGTAKLSLAARLAGRQLIVFDSFEGIPENSEPHCRNIWGGRVSFAKGDYRGDIEEVIENVRRFGDIGVCRFIKGFFDDCMPGFQEPLVLAYLDVDLASSTRTCLKHLWPLLAPGGILYSQDGHLPLVIAVFSDEKFWREELKTPKPHIHGLGTSQLIWCRKEA